MRTKMFLSNVSDQTEESDVGRLCRESKERVVQDGAVMRFGING